jgi:hypothetical protein
VYAAIVSNGYGQFDPVLRDQAPAPALGPEGLAHLRQRLEALRARHTCHILTYGALLRRDHGRKYGF